MLRCLTWTFALLSVSLASPVSSNSKDKFEYYCGRQVYGLPNIVDCHLLLESFAIHEDNVLRAFDEEQLRVDQQGSWPGAVDAVGASHVRRVVQVPRYYSLSMYDPQRIYKIEVLIEFLCQIRAILLS